MRESTKASLYNDVLLGFSVYLTIFFLRVYVTLYRMHCSCHHTYNHLQFFIINTTIIIISARNKCSVLFYFTFFFCLLLTFYTINCVFITFYIGFVSFCRMHCTHHCLTLLYKQWASVNIRESCNLITNGRQKKTKNSSNIHKLHCQYV